MTIPKKVERRISQAFLKLRPLLEEAKKRDVNEADTGTLVKAVLSDAFGWDPFFEVTSEFAIRSTYVDLAVKTDNQVGYLIEVKAIGSDLRDNHLRQAVNYAANQGVDWVVLTNGAVWQAFRVTFGKPIGHELVFDLDLLSANPKDARVRETAFLLSKEGMTKSAIIDPCGRSALLHDVPSSTAAPTRPRRRRVAVVPVPRPSPRRSEAARPR
jgi:predicted type IV restriction endonuclease